MSNRVEFGQLTSLQRLRENSRTGETSGAAKNELSIFSQYIQENTDKKLSEEDLSEVSSAVLRNIDESIDTEEELLNVINSVFEELDAEEQTTTAVREETTPAVQTKTVNDIVYEELDAEIATLEAELAAAQDSQGLFGTIGSWFGGGTAATEKALNEKKALLEAAKADPSKLAEAYEAITGGALTEEVLAQKHEAIALENYLNPAQKAEITAALQAQGAMLAKSVQSSIEGEGWVGQAFNWVNGALGIGTSGKEATAQAQALTDMLAEMDPESPDFAAQFKAITGKEFTVENIQAMSEGAFLFEDSSAAESLYDFETTQESAVNGIANTVAGIASAVVVGVASAAGVVAAPFTAGASLGLVAGGIALGASVGAAVNVGVKALDGLTSDDGYSWKEAGKDALSGGLSGALGVYTNGAGAAISKSIGGSVLKATGKEVLANVAGKVVGGTVEGVIDGAVGNTGEYLIDTTVGDTEFSWQALGETALIGGVVGGITGAATSAIEVGFEEGSAAIKRSIHSTEQTRIFSELTGNTEAARVFASSPETMDKLIEMQAAGAIDVNEMFNFNSPAWCKNGTLSDAVMSDVDRLYNAFAQGGDLDQAVMDAFVPSFSGYDEALETAAVGDVIRLNPTDAAGQMLPEKLLIKDASGALTELNMSAETYMELFPPVTRYASSQVGTGDCYLVTSLTDMLENPNARAELLKSITENPDGSLITTVGGVSYTLPAGQNLIDNASLFDGQLIDGCKGMQLLEYGYGASLTDQAVQTGIADFTNKMTPTVNIIEDIQARLDSNNFEDVLAPDGSVLYDAATVRANFENTLAQYEAILEQQNLELSRFLDHMSQPSATIELLNEGGLMSDVYDTFGYSPDVYYGDSFEEGMAFLATHSGDSDNYIMSAGTRADGFTHDHSINRTNSLYNGHAYRVTPETLENGTVVYNVINPWASGQTIQLSEAQMRAAFDQIHVANVGNSVTESVRTIEINGMLSGISASEVQRHVLAQVALQTLKQETAGLYGDVISAEVDILAEQMAEDLDMDKDNLLRMANIG